MNIKELLQKRAALVAELRAISTKADAENRDLNTEERAKAAALDTEINALKDRVDRETKLAALESELRAIPEQAVAAVAPKPGSAALEAFTRYLRKQDFEARDLQQDSNTAGGYLVPDMLLGALQKKIDDMAVMRTLSTVTRLQGAKSLGIPVIDANPADADWTGEVSAVSADSTMAFGRRELTPHLLTKLVKVSRVLLQNDPAAASMVIDRLGYKFGISQEKGFMTGTGASQPLGVFTASANGINTDRDYSTGNGQTTIVFDNLIGNKFNIKAGYQANASWIFHRDAVSQIMKIKDGDGQYIWQPSTQQVQPDRLLGLPVYMSEYAPNTFTTGLYVGIVGDFRYYQIAESMGVEVQRVEELYAGNNQVGFFGRAMVDGMPVFSEAFSRVKLG